MNRARELEDSLRAASEAVRSADALLIGAGAGMGVDSGLPDFRGDEGFWKAYPPFRGRSFAEISTPSWFHRDPSQVPKSLLLSDDPTAEHWLVGDRQPRRQSA